MHPYRSAILCLLVLLSLGGVAFAQTSPTNVIDGCSSGGFVPQGTGFTDVDLFTVPAGMDFVLTDLDWEWNSSNNPLLTDGANQLRWRLQPASQGTRSWTTGTRFTAGEIVRIRFPRFTGSGATYQPICWAGYVSQSGTSSVGDGGNERLGFKLGPNPGGGGATLWFRLDRAGPVTLAVYDTQGRLVYGQKFDHMSAGERSVRWDGRDGEGKKIESGVYFARLETPGERHGAKIVRVR